MARFKVSFVTFHKIVSLFLVFCHISKNYVTFQSSFCHILLYDVKFQTLFCHMFQSSFCHMAPQMSHSGRVRTTHPQPCEYFHPGEKFVSLGKTFILLFILQKQYILLKLKLTTRLILWQFAITTLQSNSVKTNSSK